MTVGGWLPSAVSRESFFRVPVSLAVFGGRTLSSLALWLPDLTVTESAVFSLCEGLRDVASLEDFDPTKYFETGQYLRSQEIRLSLDFSWG